MKIYESMFEELWTAAGIDLREPVVISIVGAGGKTSLLKHFSNVLNLKKIHHIIGTTTHMWPMDAGEYGIQIGEIGPDGKIKPPNEEEWKDIFLKRVPVLIEADGSKGFPCKAPEIWEPVVRKETTHVFAVLGVSSLGKCVKDVCHRPERVQDILACKDDHRLTIWDLMQIMTCEQGLKKNIPNQCKFYAVLNQVDDEVCYEHIRKIENYIRGKNADQVFFTRLK